MGIVLWFEGLVGAGFGLMYGFTDGSNKHGDMLYWVAYPFEIRRGNYIASLAVDRHVGDAFGCVPLKWLTHRISLPAARRWSSSIILISCYIGARQPINFVPWSAKVLPWPNAGHMQEHPPVAL